MSTIKDINKFLEQLLSSGEEQVHNICFFMLNTGLRLAHILDIKFSDIDFTKGHLQTVNKRNLPGEEKINIKLSNTSLIFLVKIRNKYPDDTWVFQSRKSDTRIKKQSHCLNSQAVVDKIKLINQDLDLKLSPNSFRHAYATSYLR
tara:strand:+ start:241 stop:678 length:438 start_codon:yes stop_codon:yes gene_type:complete